MTALANENKELRALCAGLADRLEKLQRELGEARNTIHLDDHKIIELARRKARPAVTPEAVEAWYRTTDYHRNPVTAPEHDTNWEDLWPWHREVIIEAARHFGTV